MVLKKDEVEETKEGIKVIKPSCTDVFKFIIYIILLFKYKILFIENFFKQNFFFNIKILLI